MAANDPTDPTSIVIDCSDCPRRQGEHECSECIVAYLIDRPEGAVVFDAAEERALRALSDGGLLPQMRWDRRSS